jgi:hypothetical protein
MAQNSDSFRNELRSIMKKAESLGLVAIDVKSGNIHRRVGGYPGTDHRMPVCCEVMYSEMKDGDTVVAKTDSGHGASIVVRYGLPRK